MISSMAREVCNFLRGTLAYYKAMNSLNSLSDRDLKDVGISRCEIKAVALTMKTSMQSA
jgi:uncharacterized protein YjiS (DUF1127 family)